MSNFKKSPMYHSYRTLLKTDVLDKDPVQNRIAQHFGQLQNQIITPEKKRAGFFASLLGGKNDNLSKQGLYLHGGVGRGKTFLMDLFFSTTEIQKKHRVHFYNFMLKTHDALHGRRNSEIPMRYNKDSALLDYAEELAGQYKLLCLDELHVKDITDAMILGRLFTRLLDLGTYVVFTSNFDIDDLYEDGLQRELFLPFISLIKQRLDIVHMQSDKDYRLNRAWAEGTWFTPLTPQNHEAIENVFRVLISGEKCHDIVLHIKGRDLIAKRSTVSTARFGFSELCGEARGAIDYLAICRHFNTVILLNVPHLGDAFRNETRRFITLVDTLYENNINLIISADTTLDNLYTDKENAFEFKRTFSRLQEMQSQEYWESS